MIEDRYALLSRIPLFEAADGSIKAGRLWAKDLLLHLDYLPDFRICCPLLPEAQATEPVTALPGLGRDRVIPLRRDGGWGSVLANLVPNFLSVLRAVRTSDIVHASGAGWAFSPGYYLLALRPFLAFRWIMVIESSFWMIPANARAGLKARLAERIHRRLLRRCLKAADARIFTQDWYRETLLGETENCLIAPASWIDEEVILDAAALAPRAPGPLRLLYPSRLEPEKGAGLLLEAIAAYERRAEAPPLRLDIIGAGSMADEVKAFATAHRGRIETHFLDPVAYGAPFFALLRGYDGVVIANRTEEQPRIVFDAFSQGLPCLASRTTGNASVIADGRTGYFFAPGDAGDLAAQLAALAAAPDRLSALRPAVLAAARDNTHQEMHRKRERFLKAALALE